MPCGMRQLRSSPVSKAGKTTGAAPVTVEFSKPGLAWLNDPDFRVSDEDRAECQTWCTPDLPEAFDMTNQSLQQSARGLDAEHASRDQNQHSTTSAFRGQLCVLPAPAWSMVLSRMNEKAIKSAQCGDALKLVKSPGAFSCLCHARQGCGAASCG